LLQGPGLHAQGATAGEAAPLRALTLRFYAYGSGSFEGLQLQTAPRERVSLRLIPGSPTAAYAYRGPSTLRLWKEETGPDGTPVARAVTEVEVPEGLREVFVLVVAPPGATTVDELRLFVSDDSASAVPRDHLAFLNFTGARLEGQVGETPVALGPGLSRAISVEPDFGRSSVLVGLTVRYRDSQRIVLEHRGRFHAGRRTLIVLLPPEQAGSFDIVAFRIQDLMPTRDERVGAEAN